MVEGLEVRTKGWKLSPVDQSEEYSLDVKVYSDGINARLLELDLVGGGYFIRCNKENIEQVLNFIKTLEGN